MLKTFLLSIIFSNGIPDHQLGDPHIIISDEGAFACIDISADGSAISSWSMVMTDEHNMSDGILVVTPNQVDVDGWWCSETNLVGLHEVEEEGTIEVVWDALAELRRQGMNCPQTCGTTED